MKYGPILRARQAGTVLSAGFIAMAAGCVSQPQQVDADHLVGEAGSIMLKYGNDVRFRTKDGFEVSTAGAAGKLVVSEAKVCGPLHLYRASPDSPSPAWGPAPGTEYLRFQPFDCLARDNIQSTTMTVQRTNVAASAACAALLPLCVLAHSIPGQ